LPHPFNQVDIFSPFNQRRVEAAFENLLQPSGEKFGSFPYSQPGSRSDSNGSTGSSKKQIPESTKLLPIKERIGSRARFTSEEKGKQRNYLGSTAYDTAMSSTGGSSDPFSYMEEASDPTSSSSLPRSPSPSRSLGSGGLSTIRDISTLPAIDQAQAAPSHPDAQRQPFEFDPETTSLASTSDIAQTYADSFVQRYHSSYYRDHRRAIDTNDGTRAMMGPPDLRAPWTTRNYTFEPHTLSSLRTPATEVRVKDTQAFITFEAGAQLKDVDLFTNSHPLPAWDMNKRKTAVPFHVPL
jgi:hypothetical protein